MIHANSRASFRECDFTDREREIVREYRDAIQPLTDREVMQRLGFADPNMVRPSITRMVERGFVVEVRNVYDPRTNRRVRCCTMARPPATADTPPD